MRDDRYDEYKMRVSELEQKKEELQRGIRELEKEDNDLFGFKQRSCQVIEDLRSDWGHSKEIVEMEDMLSAMMTKAHEFNQEKKESWTKEVKRLEIEIEDCHSEYDRVEKVENTERV